MDTIAHTNDPITPASRPTMAPAPIVTGCGWFCCIRYAASAPPKMIHAQQQFARLMRGSADSTPIATPPSRAGWVLDGVMAHSLVQVQSSKFKVQNSKNASAEL